MRLLELLTRPVWMGGMTLLLLGIVTLESRCRCSRPSPALLAFAWILISILQHRGIAAMRWLSCAKEVITCTSSR